MAITILPNYAAEGVARGEQTANNVLGLKQARDDMNQKAAIQFGQLANQAWANKDAAAAQYWKDREADLTASVGNSILDRGGRIRRTNTIARGVKHTPELQRENEINDMLKRTTSLAQNNAVPSDMFKDRGLYDMAALQELSKTRLSEANALVRSQPYGPIPQEVQDKIAALRREAADANALFQKLYTPAIEAAIVTGDSRLFSPSRWKVDADGNVSYVPTHLKNVKETSDFYDEVFEEGGDYRVGAKDEDAWTKTNTDQRVRRLGL